MPLEMVEPITMRQSRLHQLINGKATKLLGNSNHSTKEVLLDTLIAVYEELNKDHTKNDKFVTSFLEKFRPFVSQVNALRVNITDFEIKQVIGRGHFGEVKLVREKLTGDVFAMKILKKADTLALQNVTFYEEERDIMAQAASPWITCLRYAFQDPLCLYLVMDFHPGGDLFGLLDRLEGTLSEEATRFYVAELAMAINSLHKMGYVHRDIKPENILFDRLGHLKLADFGSAARLDCDGKVTSSMPVGTAEYIAPEVLTAMDAESDRKRRPSYGIECDYWSLGIVGYEMIYGSTPFHSENRMVLVNQIQNHQDYLKFPKDVSVSDEFRNFIACLLQDSPGRAGHKEVMKHPFFHPIDWENIREMLPEHVPQVNSMDDTSNFEEFEHQQGSLSVDHFISKGGFTGRNLPFVGFTFTRGDGRLELEKVVGVEKEKENHNPKRRSLLEVNVVVNDKNKFNEITQRLTTEIKRRRQADEKIKTLENSLDESQKTSRERRAELQKAVTMLEKERAERQASEAVAIVKVRDMKNNMKEKFDASLSAALGETEAYKGKCRMLEGDCSEMAKTLKSVYGDLEIARKENQVLRSKHNEYKEKNMQTRRSVAVAAVKGVNALETHSGGVNDSVMEFRSNELKIQLDAVKEELLNLQKEKEELKKEKEELKVEVDRLHELDFEKAENDSRIRELEDDLADKEAQQEALQLLGDENKELKIRIAKLESENNAVTSNFTVTSSKYLELQVKVSLLEKTLSESSLNSSIATSRSNGDLDALQNRVHTLNDELAHAREARTRSLVVIKQLTEEKQQLKEEIVSKERDFQLKVSALDSHNDSVSSRDSAIASASPSPMTHGLIEQHESTIKRLESQLQSARDLNTAERKRIREVHDELTVKSKEAADSKIDLRICKRKLEQREEALESLGKEEKSWSEKLLEKDKEVIDLKAKVAGFESTVASLERSVKAKENDLKLLEGKRATEVEMLQKRIETEQKKAEAMKDLKAELSKAKDDLKIATRQKASAQDELSSVIEKLKKKDDKEKFLNEEISKLKKDISGREKKIEGLQAALVELDEENIDHLKDVQDLEASQAAMAKLNSDLVETTEKIKEDLRAAKVALNEEKSMKIFNEKKMRDLENNFKELKEESGIEITTLTSKLEEQMAYADELSVTKTELSKLVGELESEVNTLSKKHDGAEAQLIKLKEKLSDCYTKMNSFQDTTSSLHASLEEAIAKAEQYKSKTIDLENTLLAEKQHFKERDIKYEATLAQHVKLIDHLQSKIEAPPKKKKNLMEKIFGGGAKDNAGSYAVPVAYKDLEADLRKEKQNNRTMKEQNDQLRAELISVNLRGDEGGILKRASDDRKSHRGGKMAKETLVLTKVSELPGTPCQPPTKPQRMAHDIPHRFEQKINLHGTQCPLCLDNIPIGPHVAVCTECKCTAHVKCSHKLPASCGLPYAFAEQFCLNSESLPTSDLSPFPTVVKNLKGWVKMPKSGKGRWEKRFLVVDGRALSFYEHEPVTGMEPLETVELDPQIQRVFIIPAVQQYEVPHCASTDLPFVFKVETQPHTTCFPGRSFYVLASNFEEKRNWVAALEHAFNSRSDSSGHKQTAAVNMSKHCRPLSMFKSVKMDINCAVQLKEIVLLGTSEGLFSISLGDTSQTPTLIDSEGPVHQIVVVPQISVAIMIAGENRSVVMSSLSTLQTLASSSTSGAAIELFPIKDHSECHLIAAAMLEDIGRSGEAFLCAADPERVMVSRWDKALKTFTQIKCIRTTLPCSSVYFTNQSAIFGCDKLLEIDLKKFEVEDFLDAGDPTLQVFVFSSKQLSLYPLAILDVSSRKTKQSEYLICYKEFGIFVDAWGKRTRPEDIKWTRVPLAFSYQKPFLYLVNTTGVEVVRLRRDSYTRLTPSDETNSDVLSLNSAAVVVPTSLHLQIKNPRLLGFSVVRGSIFLASRLSDGQSVIELTGEAIVRRNLSDCSQDSLQSTSTEDPESRRPPLRILPGDLSSVASTTDADNFIDDALDVIDSEVDKGSEVSETSASTSGASFEKPSKRRSSDGLRRGEGKRVKFSQR